MKVCCLNSLRSRISIFLFAISLTGATAQFSYSISANYVYSLKWHRDAFFTYYSDVPNNHTGSVHGDALVKIRRLFSAKSLEWDKVSLGISSEMIYLPYSGLHYEGYEFLGNINGLDQWIHNYSHDRYRF